MEGRPSVPKHCEREGPLRVIRVDLAMSAACPLIPQQRR
jgi:hypothetical protein